MAQSSSSMMALAAASAIAAAVATAISSSSGGTSGIIAAASLGTGTGMGMCGASGSVTGGVAKRGGVAPSAQPRVAPARAAATAPSATVGARLWVATVLALADQPAPA